tara:strand:+ start:2344 stop:3279 length:936 start_codon:yes stop_codon:yes gene_type:complete
MLKLILSIFQFISSFDSLVNIQVYNDFLTLHNKTFNYDNFITFRDNMNYIHEHNKKNLSYTLGVNNRIDQNITSMNYNYIIKNTTYKTNESFIVPFEVDWRDKNVVTSVKNQGKCGSCWAFSATGSIESVNAIDTGNLINISEQQLMDCSSDYGNKGCQGGAMDNAFKFVIDNGICSEEEYPYTSQQGLCQPCKEVVRINNYKDIMPNNEGILKRAVAQQPVSAAIQANLMSFQLYSSGIYSDPNCGTKLDHGILIIGYGYDPEYNMDYWIIKNSWGENWGENGYIRIQRNVNQSSGLCGITLNPSIPLLR